jgi:hypothetical protein
MARLAGTTAEGRVQASLTGGIFELVYPRPDHLHGRRHFDGLPLRWSGGLGLGLDLGRKRGRAVKVTPLLNDLRRATASRTLIPPVRNSRREGRRILLQTSGSPGKYIYICVHVRAAILPLLPCD